jgi:hypothetical protein
MDVCWLNNNSRKLCLEFQTGGILEQRHSRSDVWKANRSSVSMSIEKRYQVFVSSTYQDLKEERQQVIQALLELNCFPCGMEYFPAANEEVWEAIKSLIKNCDYYLVIVAGRYGSVDEEGISYTQKEYEYADQIGIPVLAFLHRDPESIPKGKSEPSQARQKKLEQFRDLCRKRVCKEWDSPSDLRANVTTSLVHEMNRHAAVGWVRGDLVPDESAAQTINRLRNENDELKVKLETMSKEGPPGTDQFAQGNDSFILHYWCRFAGQPSELERARGALYCTWNEIFTALATKMLTAVQW